MVLRERAVPDLKGTTLDQEKIYPLIPFNWRVNSTLHIFSRLQGSLHLLVALICPCFKSFFFFCLPEFTPFGPRASVGPKKDYGCPVIVLRSRGTSQGTVASGVIARDDAYGMAPRARDML